MSGTPNTRMFKTMVEKHGSEEAARAWFREIGGKGGKNGNTGGFASTSLDKNGMNGKQRAQFFGRLGGTISRRRSKVNVEN